MKKNDELKNDFITLITSSRFLKHLPSRSHAAIFMKIENSMSNFIFYLPLVISIIQLNSVVWMNKATRYYLPVKR